MSKNRGFTSYKHCRKSYELVIDVLCFLSDNFYTGKCMLVRNMEACMKTVSFKPFSFCRYLKWPNTL